MKLLIAAAIAYLIGSVKAVELKNITLKKVGKGWVEILGAAYGPADVTEKVRQIYNGGEKVIKAENSVFGDSWYGVEKTLSISYRYCDDSKTKSVKEGGNIMIPD